MRRLLYITGIVLASVLCLVVSACSTDDDINEIFVGKTWYFRGARINGVTMNSDVKEFYAHEDTYHLNLSVGTFSGILSAGTDLSGSWSADGGSRTFSFNITRQTGFNSATPIAQKVLNVLKNVRNYTGDSNVIYLKADDDNYVMLSSQKFR